MLTEECHLNPYLERHGIEVVDTDLGERIVQLRDEPPSHIVLPAIHIKKEEVGELFHRALGTDRGRDRSEVPGRSRPAAPAGQVHAGRRRDHRRQLRHRRNRRLRRLHERRQRRPGRLAAQAAHRLHGHREADSAGRRTWASSCGCWPARPPASRSRRTRRTSTARCPAASCTSCWSTTAAAASGRTTNSAARCNCIRCGACMNTCPVYRRSGGYSYHEHGSRPDRLDPGPAAGSQAQLQPAVRLQPVRFLHRRLPGEDSAAPSTAHLAGRDRAQATCCPGRSGWR